jgi:2,4-dienoyl-CoA reductase (NADPH2)
MSKHEKFNFRTKESLLQKIDALGVDIPFSDDVSVLFERVPVAGRTLANRFVVQPMEGADADGEGAPGELTFRRYRRYAAGGSGLIWFEATAVSADGRSNPRQLLLSEKNIDGFKRLVDATRQAARASGVSDSPMLVLQLTHAGRNARPVAAVARANPILETVSPLPGSFKTIDDDELDRMQDFFVRGAVLAEAAGFDAVDVKACHGYLVNELLASFTRSGSRYGGSFENRSRLLREILVKIGTGTPGIRTCSRISIADFLPYPFGFGMSPTDAAEPDITETVRLIRTLIDSGCGLMNLSLGNPRYAPHFVRPFDTPLRGGAIPEEHPLEGVARLLGAVGDLQQRFPLLPMIGCGYSWLRQFLPYVAAGSVQQKKSTLIGLGRESLAYPDAVRDLQTKGTLDPLKVCTACSSCSQLLRDGGRVGCVIRDKEVY